MANEALTDAASVVTIFGGFLGLIALVVAVITLIRTNKIGSAGAVLTFYQSASQGWERVIKQHEAGGNLTHPVGELLNTLELGACLYDQNIFTGDARDMLGKYIRECMATIDDVPAIKSVKSTLISGDPLTFKFLVKLRFSAD